MSPRYLFGSRDEFVGRIRRAEPLLVMASTEQRHVSLREARGCGALLVLRHLSLRAELLLELGQLAE